MPVAFDADLTTFGSAALTSPGELSYGDSRIITLGPGVPRYDPPDGTHVRGLGWFSIGFTNDDGSGDKEYYSEPIFIVFDHQLYRFGNLALGGSPRWGPYADSIRWWIQPGSTVHLWMYVFD